MSFCQVIQNKFLAGDALTMTGHARSIKKHKRKKRMASSGDYSPMPLPRSLSRCGSCGMIYDMNQFHDCPAMSPYISSGSTEPVRFGRNTDMTSTTDTIIKKVGLASVILHPDKKQEIQVAMSQIENSKLIFDQWGFGDVFEKGTAITLLFYGVPGTGKTLMAQAIADELGAELKVYGSGEIQSSEPGGAERTIKKIFDEARTFFTNNRKQRVILFDECDSLLYDRNKVGVILGAQINAILTEIEKHDGIIIFTTNRMGTLDPALERRIAAKIEFPFPDKAQREAIWRRMIPAKAPVDTKVNFKKLADYPLAGGHIKNAVLNAARMAAYEKAPKIMMKHFKDAIEKESIAAQAFSNSSEALDYGNDPQIIDGHKIELKRREA